MVVYKQRKGENDDNDGCRGFQPQMCTMDSG